MNQIKNPCTHKALSLAIGAAALGLGAVGAARAEVYGIATDQITAFSVSAATGTLTSSNGSTTSAASATFNGTGASTSHDFNTMPAMSGPGPFPADNSGYNQTTVAVPAGTIGSFGDSTIFGSSFAGPGTANAVAQSRLISSGAGSAEGRDLLTFNFTLSSLATVTVSFFDNPNLQAFSNVSNGKARASETVHFSIADINNLTGGGINSLVFDFQPDGTLGGVNNTTVTSDPFSLNQQILSLGTQGLVNMNGGVTTNPGNNFYSAFTTRELPAGTYRFDGLVQTNVSITDIPEPTSILLSAFALMALGVTVRRKAG